MFKWFLLIVTQLFIVALLIFGIYIYQGDLPADQVDAEYSSPASEFLMLENGTRLHFRDEGNPAGLPVVLVHGSSASLHTFEPWVALLGDEYRMITLDLPGHGLTGATPDADYSTEAFIRALQQLVAHLEVSRFVLGGNSMGGGLAWRYAAAYPEQVAALLLIAASGYFGEEAAAGQAEEEEEESVLVFFLLQQPWFRALVPHLNTRFLTEQGVRTAYNHSEVVTEELVERYYKLSLRAGTRRATIARFAAYDPTQQVEVPQDLMQPTLLMWGREDALLDVAMAAQFKAAIPHARVVIYDDIGHIPMEEVPARSAADVRDFLGSLGGKP